MKESEDDCIHREVAVEIYDILQSKFRERGTDGIMEAISSLEIAVALMFTFFDEDHTDECLNSFVEHVKNILEKIQKKL